MWRIDRRLIPILFLTLVNVLSFSLLIPVFPYIIEKYHADPMIYGILLSVFPFFQFFAAPLLGAWSDRDGRRPILLVSQLGTTLSWVVFGCSFFFPTIPLLNLALPIWVIFFSRVVDGITGGNNAVANAYISDITEPNERARVFGLTGGILGVGLIIGPALGGMTSSGSWEYLGTAILGFLISLVTLFFIMFALPESLPEEERDRELDFRLVDELNFWFKLQKYRHNKMLMNVIAMRTLYALAFGGYTSLIVLFAQDSFQLNPRELGILFLCIGMFLIVNQIVVARKIIKVVGSERGLKMGVMITLIGFLCIPLNTVVETFILNAYLMNLGFSLCLPAFRALITNSVDRNKQGDIMGIDESIFAICSAIAPLVAGFTYARIHAVFFVWAAAFLAVGFIYFLLREWRLSRLLLR